VFNNGKQGRTTTMIDLVALGKIAGIAGVALGVFLLLYRDILRKRIFSRLPPVESYRILRLIIVLTWTIAVFGMFTWWQGSHPSEKPQAPTSWRTSGLLDELDIGLSRDYVIKQAGTPRNSIEATVGKTNFRVDRYGDNCCGEIILFYVKNSIAAYSVKHFAKPNFDFQLLHPTEERFYLGKVAYHQLGEPNSVIKDYIVDTVTECYEEYFSFGNVGKNFDYLYASVVTAEWFDREKYKEPRSMPVHSTLVNNSELFCSAEDVPDGYNLKVKGCLSPWYVVCAYFDKLQVELL
jgi:hypothetical protein